MSPSIKRKRVAALKALEEASKPKSAPKAQPVVVEKPEIKKAPPAPAVKKAKTDRGEYKW